MIIKQAVVDRRRVTWRSVPNLQSVPDTDESSLDLVNEAIDGRGNRSGPELDVETVLAWLNKQEDPVRGLLAEALSADMERVREQAREQGLAAGHGEGLERAAIGAQRLIDVLGLLARESKGQFEHECEVLQGSVVTVVEAVLRKIAGPLLASESAVVGATLEVLRQCTHGLDLRIFVSAADLLILEAARPQLTLALGQRPFELLPDDDLVAGGCRVEGSLGVVDGSLALQCEELCALLRDARGQRDGVQT